MTTNVRALLLSRKRNLRSCCVVDSVVYDVKRCSSYRKKVLHRDRQNVSNGYCGSVNGPLLGDGDGDGFALVAGVGCAGCGGVGLADGDGDAS